LIAIIVLSRECDRRRFVLGLEPEHDHAWMFAGRVSADVCEIEIKREQDATLGPDACSQHLITRSRQLLIRYALCVEAGVVKQSSDLEWEILVSLELHAPCPSGSSTEPSRASSAA
jgi:hypothetical protein